MAQATQRKSGGKRKVGRNGSFCKMYRDRGTRERNKLRKVRRHFKRFPADKQAEAWLAK